jgi:hypothetical protein
LYVYSVLKLELHVEFCVGFILLLEITAGI